ncbi:hypothetical protein BGZ61DRAFT_195615 [Ilyonectria robusta]|uniref:uncharacterized protein n=1 Tax=Ilyonectria robusta TaxID=1079257 RepID=UPI001E8D6422|nr:uncharacterized protein BGZ61DRAFT_195615 [Ilyonectria robusta]KAH8721836.1 hypothetical protein BGZ61DRAFT_195615 [Ilyonectria robusta]
MAYLATSSWPRLKCTGTARTASAFPQVAMVHSTVHLAELQMLNALLDALLDACHFLPAPGQSATPRYHLHYNSVPTHPIQVPPITSRHLPLTHKFSHLARLHLLKTSPMQLLGLRQLPPTPSQRTNQPANPEPPSLPRLCPVSMPILLHLANSTSLLTSPYAKADAALKARVRHGTDIPPSSGIPPVPCPACTSLRLPSLPPTSPACPSSV